MSENPALNRLLRIKWHENWDRTSSSMALLAEYLRREALWVKALDYQRRQWRFYDFAAVIDPTIRADERDIEVVNQFPCTSVGRNICTWYLHWVALEGAGKTTPFNLPPLYEPLIVLFERGAMITLEHGFVDILGAGKQPQSPEYYLARPPLDMSEEALNRLDVVD
jgi:hypothetical protein